MTLTDEFKILDDMIKANQAQYNLDRKAAKMYILLSKELDKYEYLTGGDFEYRPQELGKVKFEYSPLGQALNNKAKSKAGKI